MPGIMTGSVVGGLVLLFCAGLSYAEDSVSRKELRMAIAGNTIEGRIVASGATYRLYFHPLGNWFGDNGSGQIDTGRWKIDQQEALCIGPGADYCLKVKKRAEGQYNLLDRQGELAMTVDRVVIGNPDRLQDPAASKNSK